MLTSARLRLTPLQAEDKDSLFAWINERESVLFNAPYKPIAQDQHQKWFDSIQSRNDCVIFGIRVIETNHLIGSCQLHSIHAIHRSAELQIRIGEVEFRGRGFGTEATLLLLHFAFKDLNLQRVYLHVFATNERAVQMYRKIGFIVEGTLRRAVYIDGEYVDMLIMGILREDYHGAS